MLAGGIQAQQSVTADDIAILKAVIDQKIRPEAERFAPKDRPPGVLPIIVSDRTLSMCGPEGSPIPDIGCIGADHIPLLNFGRDMTPATQGELQDAIPLRNAVSVPFPTAKFDSLVPVGPGQRSEVTKREERRTRGWASFGLPVYATSGQVVVYARYICGGLCGASWYFLLEKSANGWRVVADRAVAVS